MTDVQGPGPIIPPRYLTIREHQNEFIHGIGQGAIDSPGLVTSENGRIWLDDNTNLIYDQRGYLGVSIIPAREDHVHGEYLGEPNYSNWNVVDNLYTNISGNYAWVSHPSTQWKFATRGVFTNGKLVAIEMRGVIMKIQWQPFDYNVQIPAVNLETVWDMGTYSGYNPPGNIAFPVYTVIDYPLGIDISAAGLMQIEFDPAYTAHAEYGTHMDSIYYRVDT